MLYYLILSIRPQDVGGLEYFLKTMVHNKSKLLM